MTKTFGILAYPAKHSLSPPVQNAAFKACGLDAVFRCFEIHEDKLSEFMDQVKHDPISGLSVSQPHKQMIMQYLDVIDDDAKKIGAVNTVLNKGGFLHGYNVDFVGANAALKEAVGDLKGKSVCVLGAGGAARAVCYGLLKEGAGVFILNRHKEKADKIAEEFSKLFDVEVGSGCKEDCENFPPMDILIQATSIWILKPDVSAEEVEKFCPSAFIEKFEIVMDIVYKPLLTPLIKTAERLGKKTITGDKMFLYQAREQFKIWTGKEAPFEVMKETLENVLV